MKRTLYAILALVLLAPVSTIYALDGFPAFPMAFWGNVTINGSAAPVGTVVRAYYGSTLAGMVVVEQSGVYGYTEATKQKLVVAEGVGQLSFKIQSVSFNSGAETAGSPIVSYSGFISGATISKDLAFMIPVPIPTQASSGGGGSSSGGGGGGGGSIVTQQAITIKGDATGDGKVDIFDFNAFLIQWGKAGNSLSADFDKSGTVDIFDFNWMLINWTK